MKRILLAPFLLATLFSFGSELKAHPARMDSGFEPSSKIPAQVRDDTKWLSFFGISYGNSNGNNFSVITIPYKNQQSCIRYSNTLRAELIIKFSSNLNEVQYYCLRVNK